MVVSQVPRTHPPLHTLPPHPQVARTSSQAAEVVRVLFRRNAWVVTGTPVTQALEEIRGLCHFLALEPYLEVGGG